MNTSNSKTATQQAGTRASGAEATRIKMLDAALDIMIEEGMRAVRHRAVALRAGVSLGSTTYHFDNIEEIIISAFEHWRSRALTTDNIFFRRTKTLLAPYAGRVIPEDERPQIAAEIYDISLGYLCDQLTGKRRDRLLELAFHHESVRYPTLHQLVVREGKEQLDYLTLVHQSMGSTAPDEDACLTYSLFRQLEQSAVIEGSPELDVNRIKRVLRRHTALCFNIELPSDTCDDA
ncbi:HTH-type transcriptional regulator RcdA [Halioglobus japonicus]|nr:HTH-type transcriptional regulator RcdA [Halioglobus japonicus]